MKTFIVDVHGIDLDVPRGAVQVAAWTMKGARRRFRKRLRAEGVLYPEVLTLDTMEVVMEEASGEVREILAREIAP